MFLFFFPWEFNDRIVVRFGKPFCTHINLLDRKKVFRYLNLGENSKCYTCFGKSQATFVPFVISEFGLLNDLNIVSKKDPFDGLNHDTSFGSRGWGGCSVRLALAKFCL